MALTLDSWLDTTHRNTSEQNMFFSLVEHFGMKIPIVAAQKPFEKGEPVFLTLPTFVTPRYDEFYYNPIGKVTIVDRDETHGFYLAGNREEHAYLWLPCFFFHRDSSLAKQMFKQQLEHMIEVDKKEARSSVPLFERTYNIPASFSALTQYQLDSLFYEAYDKPCIADIKEKTKSLGF